MKYQLGVIHGRFQGLHLGHMEYLLEGKKRCEHLFIGITNYDLNEKKEIDSYNPTRTKKSSNPFTYFERYMMLKLGLLEYGVKQEEFDIVPFPIESPKRIINFVPKDATFFVTIYDKWGEHKEEILSGQGLKTEIMWIRDNNSRITSGTEIRQLIANGGEWENLVPKSVYNYITKNGLDKRILVERNDY